MLRVLNTLQKVAIKTKKSERHLAERAATLLLSNGTNIKNVASRLGHSQLKTTNRYVHAVEQAEKGAANT